VILVIHAAATWFMVGLIWTIQVVHYPLFQRVDADSFGSYEAGHTRRMGMLLLVPASLEVVTAGALVWVAPSGAPMVLVLAGGALLAAIWITTALVQFPLHRRLGAGHDAPTIRRLISTNWYRTVAWTARGGFAALLIA
jgi:hypothetical protein